MKEYTSEDWEAISAKETEAYAKFYHDLRSLGFDNDFSDLVAKRAFYKAGEDERIKRDLPERNFK
jgi:hypothetical protein